MSEERIKEMAGKGMDSYEIDKEISRMDLSESSKIELKSKVDKYVLNFQLFDQVKSKFRSQFLLGLVFFVIGLAITIYTWSTGNGGYIIAWGAIIGGGGLALNAYTKIKKLNSENFEENLPQRKMRESKFKKKGF